MGFTFAPPTYSLDFSKTRLTGLEIKVKSVSIGEFMAVLEMRLATDEFLKELADSIVSWNVTGANGRPAKPSLAELKKLDAGAIRLINRAWLEAIGGVGEELGKDSDSGETSQELSMPMELSSPSQES